MKIYSFLSLCILLQLSPTDTFAQGKIFNTVIEEFASGGITSVKQDREGFIWFTCTHYGGNRGGIHKYDGHEVTSYFHDPKNNNSLADDWAECLYIDSNDIIWIGTYAGLDRFDPATNRFTHFSHSATDPSSISSDTIQCIVEDYSGNLWIGTGFGLNFLNKATGKFKHYMSSPNDLSSLSSNLVRVIYEDNEKILWVGCGNPAGQLPGVMPGDRNGGLNRFDRATGKFTRYLHDPTNSNSIANEKVSAIFEDRKGTFWVGTDSNELHTLNRATGIFTHYYQDPAHPEKLIPSFFNPIHRFGHIRFMTEDPSGSIWIGTFPQGMNKYDPETRKITNYGSITDSVSGLSNRSPWNAFLSKDGLLWLCSMDGSLMNVDVNRITIPYYPVKDAGNTFYFDLQTNTLWIGTDSGLIQKNLSTKFEKTWSTHNSDISNKTIAAMRMDADGKLWMATSNGLNKFDLSTKVFTSYWPDEKNKASNRSGNILDNLIIDDRKKIWLATRYNGVYRMNPGTGLFINYSNNPFDSNSLSNNYVICIAEDHDNKIWAGTFRGLNKLNDDKFQHYLKELFVKNVFVDATGVIWAGTSTGLYRYDSKTKNFSGYTNSGFGQRNDVLHIMEDNKQNLWVSTSNSIVKINKARDSVKVYGERYGIHHNAFLFSDNLIAPNGELFFGDLHGYYAFFPEQLRDDPVSMHLNFTGFKLRGLDIKPGNGGILNAAIWDTKEIELSYKQNAFTFEFAAINYKSAQPPTYMFKLENFDNNWSSIGTDRKADFFNIPPGRYIFHLRAVGTNGLEAEKEISVIITPPWWTTWWAYTIFGLLFISAVWAVIYYRSKALRDKNKVLEEKVAHRTQQLQQSLENLKATQQQLIQSEKMASLGELTAGIAHEIQNPLNFVNNFSEVNKELVDELEQEADKGNLEEVKAIAKDIKDNEEKIIHHGKRADAIVKGMLQHSRSSSGVKEPTDINALCDEYLRLAYHGLRAKDKSFSAKYETDFDSSIGKINIVPQDIGRVLLNLINNAFYVVTEKKQQLDGNYEPTVSVSTKRLQDKVEIKVKDNGTGVPQKVLDKIFQPFFTTKPTGQGTGLGLSLSYDIIKAHGGEIKVETKEGEGAEFVIQLPPNKPS